MLLVGRQEGHLASKNMGGWWRLMLVSPDGVAPSRMVGVCASVNLPLHHKVQKFSSGIGSLGGPRKRAIKQLCVCVCVCVLSLLYHCCMRVMVTLVCSGRLECWCGSWWLVELPRILIWTSLKHETIWPAVDDFVNQSTALTTCMQHFALLSSGVLFWCWHERFGIKKEKGKKCIYIAPLL